MKPKRYRSIVAELRARFPFTVRPVPHSDADPEWDDPQPGFAEDLLRAKTWNKLLGRLILDADMMGQGDPLDQVAAWLEDMGETGYSEEVEGLLVDANPDIDGFAELNEFADPLEDVPDPDLMATISAIELRARREALGLSQSDLAATLKVKQPTVSRWELGKEPIPGGIADELAELEAVRDDIADQMMGILEDGRVDMLIVHGSNESWWATHPDARKAGIPAAVQRVAAALAAAEIQACGSPRPQIVEHGLGNPKR